MVCRRLRHQARKRIGPIRPLFIQRFRGRSGSLAVFVRLSVQQLHHRHRHRRRNASVSASLATYYYIHVLPITYYTQNRPPVPV